MVGTRPRPPEPLKRIGSAPRGEIERRGQAHTPHTYGAVGVGHAHAQAHAQAQVQAQYHAGTPGGVRSPQTPADSNVTYTAPAFRGRVDGTALASPAQYTTPRQRGSPGVLSGGSHGPGHSHSHFGSMQRMDRERERGLGNKVSSIRSVASAHTGNGHIRSSSNLSAAAAHLGGGSVSGLTPRGNDRRGGGGGSRNRRASTPTSAIDTASYAVISHAESDETLDYEVAHVSQVSLVHNPSGVGGGNGGGVGVDVTRQVTIQSEGNERLLAMVDQLRQERDRQRWENERLVRDMKTASTKHERAVNDAREEIADLKKLVAELGRDLSQMTARAERAEKMARMHADEGDALRASIRDLRAERVQLEAKLTGHEKNIASLSANLQDICDLSLPVATKTTELTYTVFPERTTSLHVSAAASLAAAFVVMPLQVLISAFTHLDLDKHLLSAAGASLSTLGGHLAQVVGCEDSPAAAWQARRTPPPSRCTPVEEYLTPPRSSVAGAAAPTTATSTAAAAATGAAGDTASDVDSLLALMPPPGDAAASLTAATPLPPPTLTPHPPDYHASVAAILERVAAMGID